MTDEEYAIKIYCMALNTRDDNGDTDTQGVIEVIGELKEREQRALEYYFRMGLSYEKTAEELGVSTATARNVIMRAKLKLRHHSRLIKMSVSRFKARLI